MNSFYPTSVASWRFESIALSNLPKALQTSLHHNSLIFKTSVRFRTRALLVPLGSAICNVFLLPLNHSPLLCNRNVLKKTAAAQQVQPSLPTSGWWVAFIHQYLGVITKWLTKQAWWEPHYVTHCSQGTSLISDPGNIFIPISLIIQKQQVRGSKSPGPWGQKAESSIRVPQILTLEWGLCIDKVFLGQTVGRKVGRLQMK